MADPKDAVATQLRNIESATGRTVQDWLAMIRNAGVERHGQIVQWLKTEHAFTHGNANAIANQALASGQPKTSDDALIDAQYAGGKAHLRPICDRLVALAQGLGSDVEVSPRKTSVSLRRSKQFALIEVPSAKRIVLGFNSKSLSAGPRLEATSGMCTHRVIVTSVDEVDDEISNWMTAAYTEA